MLYLFWAGGIVLFDRLKIFLYFNNFLLFSAALIASACCGYARIHSRLIVILILDFTFWQIFFNQQIIVMIYTVSAIQLIASIAGSVGASRSDVIHSTRSKNYILFAFVLAMAAAFSLQMTITSMLSYLELEFNLSQCGNAKKYYFFFF